LIGAIPDITGDYDVSTSWKYGIGISVNPISLLTVSGDVDFIDYSSITFAETSRELRAKNTDIRKYLQESALDYRLGVEGIVQGTGLTLRAGYGVSKTPFVRERGADITQVIMYGMGYESRNFAVKTMSFGLGYEVNESLALNAAFQVRKHDTFTLNYIDPDGAVPFSDFTTHESVTRTSILASICYRF
jgi:long-subunit fatty acid transport protein